MLYCTCCIGVILPLAEFGGSAFSFAGNRDGWSPGVAPVWGSRGGKIDWSLGKAEEAGVQKLKRYVYETHLVLLNIVKT